MLSFPNKRKCMLIPAGHLLHGCGHGFPCLEHSELQCYSGQQSLATAAELHSMNRAAELSVPEVRRRTIEIALYHRLLRHQAQISRYMTHQVYQIEARHLQ